MPSVLLCGAEANGRLQSPVPAHRGWLFRRIGRLMTPHYRDVFLKGGRHALRLVRFSRTDSRIARWSCGRGVGRVRSRALSEVGYAQITARRHLRAAEHFVSWADRHGISVSGL